MAQSVPSETAWLVPNESPKSSRKPCRNGIAVDYSLTAESEEYAAVPEFPFGSLILLASSVSAYIVLTRYSSKVLSNVISAANTK